MSSISYVEHEISLTIKYNIEKYHLERFIIKKMFLFFLSNVRNHGKTSVEMFLVLSIHH